MEDWKEQAVLKEGVSIDIGFMVRDSFYYGPDNGFTPEEYREMRELLFVPDLKRSGNFVLITEIKGQELELLKHYQNVIENYRKYDKDITKSSHFWNRPILYKENDFYIGFPWHDRFREGKVVLENLTATENGDVYWDLHQGWKLEIYGSDNFLYVRESDPDSEALSCQVKFDWNSIREQSNNLLLSVTKLIDFLSKEIGYDYWT